MMGNDKYGDCCFASVAHLVNCWMGNNDKATDVGQQEIVRDYLDHTGGQDVGAELRAVLNRFHGAKNKSIAGHRAAGFARLRFDDFRQIETAIAMFGGVYAAVNGPRNLTDMSTWATPAPSWKRADELHCIALLDYDHGEGQFKAASWSNTPIASYGWWAKYGVEAWVVLSPDWWKRGKSPSGLKLTDAFKALEVLAS